MVRIRKVLVLFIFLVVAFGFGFSYGYDVSLRRNVTNNDFLGKVLGDKIYETDNDGFSTFWEVWDLINEEYAGEIDKDKMIYGAINGMVDSLEDPYTVFLTPEENNSLLQDLEGVFGGIGAEIGFRDGYMTVIAPLKDSPAEKAGVLAKDKIIEIDGKDAEGLNINEVVDLIRGEKGTSVSIKMLRGEDEYIDFDIVRDTIVEHTVKWEEKDGNIVYIEISNFKSDTGKELDNQISDILAENPKGIILDLRNNPGGYLDVVVDVAGRFLKNGDVVVIERDSDGNEISYEASGNQAFADIPLVVLVNGGSASASEILAGALKDYEIATLVGETTFGKGLVQGLSDLEDGSALKVTVAEWLTPLRNNINKEGIKPDFEITYTLDDYSQGIDPQLDKALEILK